MMAGSGMFRCSCCTNRLFRLLSSPPTSSTFQGANKPGSAWRCDEFGQGRDAVSCSIQAEPVAEIMPEGKAKLPAGLHQAEQGYVRDACKNRSQAVSEW